ncbi:MAG: DNA photolyase family protein [Gammaproteobacteria bacterium]|nr:DNA photolyase family protein [Gammaproteobacteria bacterium]
MTTALAWFRHDLRLADNPALCAALENHQNVIPVFIHAPGELDAWQPGAASRWWLHHSLVALDGQLHKQGSRLVIRSGPNSLKCLRALTKETGATHVYWNRQYEPQHIARDKVIKSTLRDASIGVDTFNAGLMFEPWAISKKDGGPFRVFTPFWKACLKTGLPVVNCLAPQQMPKVDKKIVGESVDTLDLLPTIPWDKDFPATWQPGEAGAQAQLHAFIDGAVIDYDDNRNRPDYAGTSMLSPHLHFGEISPRQVVQAISEFADRAVQPGVIANTESYIREIGWREFAHHLLYHFPHTTDQPLDTRFDKFPWRKDHADDLRAWQRGATGIPIVDAGMRELWHTGWMHNRVRMIVASLLVKNMLIPWQAGAAWFWDTLVDADLANNTLGWQWSAGCGADAAPWFRIFNPVTQAGKFDPNGHYIRRWIPEIAELPNKYLASPWTAPAEVLASCNLQLGRDYPKPRVDLKVSRATALERFQSIKNNPRTPPG